MAKNLDLRKLSDRELLSLNHEIVALLRTRHRHNHRNELSTFDRGAKVSFQGPEGKPLSGTIVRVNQKTLTIATEHGTWRIDPCFVVDAKAPKENGGKLLKLQRSN